MKRLNVIVVNIVLFLLLFHIVDFYASLNCKNLSWIYTLHKGNKLVLYLSFYPQVHSYYIDSEKYREKPYCKVLSVDYTQKSEEPTLKSYRPIENEFATNSIVISGCSFVYGLNLSNNETFSANMGKLLPNYRIYNKALCGWSTTHLLYQLKNNDFSNIQNMKYLIHVFIPDHINRNYNSGMMNYTPYYKLNKNNTLSFQRYSLKYIFTPLFIYVKNVIGTRYLKSYKLCGDLQNYRIKLFESEIMSIKANVELSFPNSKFIVLRYDNGSEELYDSMFEDLKKKGIMVVSLADISDVRYSDNLEYQCSTTDEHPNAKAWAEITPLFVKYLQDRGYLKD